MFDLLFNIIFILIAVVIPGGMTILNCYNLFAKSPKKPKLAFWLTFLIGGLFYLLLYEISFETAGDWNEAVYTTQLHYSISTEYGPEAFYIPMLLGVFGMMLLCGCKTEKLSPLASAFAVGATVLFQVLQIAFAVQISNHVNESIEYLFYVYHANLFILAVSGMRTLMKEQVVYYESRKAGVNETEECSVKQRPLYRIVNTFSKYTVLIFVCLFFIIAVFEVLFLLFGQGLDAPIKAFTDTADWTFSKQIPPPPMEYDGHYLCTVAAGGHKKVVKPLRFGRRRGQKIVVNRQLCVANAFEDYIKEKMPRFHKAVRNFYDTHGYPLSKLITTPARADVVYVLMKPLEWCFLAFLYLFDVRPEERISRQYR